MSDVNRLPRGRRSRPGAVARPSSNRAAGGSPTRREIPRRRSPMPRVALLFEKPSTRTRVSTEMAVVDARGDTRSTSDPRRSASIRASRRRTSRASSAGTARSSRPGSSTTPRSSRMAAVIDVPVVNLLSDRAHPCQALADYLTLPRAASARSRAGVSCTSATATTSPRRSRSAPRSAASSSPSRRRRATSSTTTSSTGPRNLGGVDRARRPIRSKRCRGPTRCTPTCGRRWARRTRRSSARVAFEAYQVTPR